MIRSMRTRALPACTVFLAAFLAACGDGGREAAPAGDPTEPVRGGTVVIASGTDLDNANPLVSAEASTVDLLRFGLFTPLLRYGPELEYEPYLAESWEMTGDTGVVFHLRRDVRWHDGAPTTAHDVLFTYERATDPATAFPNSDYFGRWTGGEVVDSYTVRFTFERHAEPLAGWPFTPIVPRHLLDTIPAGEMRQAAFGQRPVGNGPFRYVSHRAGDRWIFESNPDFPAALGGPPLLDRLVWRVIPDPTAQVAELQAGEVDLALQPQVSQVATVAEQPGFRAVVKPSRQFNFIGWNARRPPLGRPEVRRALAMAIDREALLQGLRQGYGRTASGPIMPFHWAYDDDLEPLPFASDSARAALDAAGLRDVDGDGVREREDGSELTLELKVPAGSDQVRNLAEAVRSDLADVGIRIRTRQTDMSTLIGDVTSPDRRFDAVLLAWSSDLRLDLRPTFHSDVDGPYGFAGYANPEVDSLMDRASAEPRREAAAPAWHRIQRVLREEQPWTILYYVTDALLARERVRGMEMDIRGVLVTLPEWWVEPPTAEADTPQDTGGTDGV